MSVLIDYTEIIDYDMASILIGSTRYDIISMLIDYIA